MVMHFVGECKKATFGRVGLMEFPTMRILPLPYVTDHHHARVVMAAVARGLGCEPRMACSIGWLPKPAVVYGILRGCEDVIRKCEQADLPWWHIDLGYWGRGHYEGYYKLSLRGLQTQYTHTWKERTEIPHIEPWRDGAGGEIVVCPPTVSFAQNHPLAKFNEQDGTDTIVRRLQALTHRPIVVREKGDGAKPLPDDPWCVVVHSSNIAVDMLFRG